MRYEFHPEALEEYSQAALWYAQREPLIALQFVEAVEDAIYRILEAPNRWRVIEEDIRRWSCANVCSGLEKRAPGAIATRDFQL